MRGRRAVQRPRLVAGGTWVPAFGLLVSCQSMMAQEACTLRAESHGGDLTIGAAELSIGREEEAPLFRVRSGLIGADTSIVVSNSGTNEVLLFDGKGRLALALGGSGGGPGEFTRLGPMDWHTAQVVAATDFAASKVVLFDLRSGDARSISFRDERVAAIYSLPDGRWLVYGTSERPPSPSGGRFRGEGTLVLYDRQGDRVRQVLSVPGIDLYDDLDEDGGGMRGFPPFPRRTLIGVDRRGCIWVNDGGSATLTGYDLQGEAVTSLHVPDADRGPITREEWSRRIDVMVDRAFDAALRPRIRRALEGIPFDSHRPPFGALTIDDDGRLWLAPYHPPDEDIDGWWVVSGEAPAAWVPAPAGTRRLLDVRGPHALILRVDELGVEALGLHRVISP